MLVPPRDSFLLTRTWMPVLVASGQFSCLLLSPWHLYFITSIWVLQFQFSPLLLMMFEFYFNTLATWCEELTHWKRPWCWERLKVGGEGDDRGWDGWMASLTQWTWVWVDSGSWWWTERPGVLWSMGLQRVRHDWVTELHWTSSLRLHPTLSKIKNIKPCIPQCFTDTRAHPELSFLHQVLSSGSPLWFPSNWQASALIRLNFEC